MIPRVLSASLALVLAASSAVALGGGDDFFLIDNMNKGFFRGNTASVGADVLVSQPGSNFWGDLSPSDEAGHLFATRVNAQEIVKLRESDGAVTQTIGIDRELRSIGYDAAGGVFYGLNQAGTTIDLYTADLGTGVTSFVGPTAIPGGAIDAVAMTFDPLTGHLFVATLQGDLYSVDPATGASTLRGDMGLTNAFGLAYNPANGHLYVTEEAGDLLYIVRRGNAAKLLIGGPFGQATFATGISFSSPGPTTAPLIAGPPLELFEAWADPDGTPAEERHADRPPTRIDAQRPDVGVTVSRSRASASRGR